MSSTTYSKSRKRGSNSNNRNKVRYSISGAKGTTGATGAQGATSAQGTQGIEGKKAAKPQELVLDGKKFAWKETPFVDKPSGRRYQSGYAYAIISPGGFVGYEEYGEALRRKQQEYAHKTLPESPDIASGSIFSEKSKLLDKPRLDPKEAARKRLARVPAETIDGRWKAKRHAPNQRQREHLEYCSKVLENEWRKVFRRVAYYKDKGDQAKVKATLLYAGNKYLRLTREAYEKWGGDEAFSLVHVGNFNLNEKGAGAFKAYLEKQLGAVSRATFSAQDALNLSVAPIFGGKRQKEDAILDKLQPQRPKARSRADALRGPKEAPIMRSDTAGFDAGDTQFSVKAPAIDTTVRKARQFTESPLDLIPISQLHLDPERFQFKLDSKRNKSGYNPDRYRDARFNPDLAGTITVWKDPQDGKIYVVNGHHRYNIAKNSGYKGNLHVKFSPARTAEEAKFHGAIQNIADEKGTGTDVASIIRGGLTLKDIQQAGVTPKSSIVNKGVILSRLSDRLFKELEQGYNLDEDTALIIAETIPEVDDEGNVVNLNEDKQIELYEGYLRKDFENGVIPKKEYVEALAIAFSTAEGTSKGLNLFGEEDISYKKEVEARAKLLQSVLSTLRAEDRTFGRVNKKNTALLADSAVLDGTLDAVEAKRLKEAAKATIVAIKQKKNFYGPLNDILKDYTQQWVQASSDAQKKAITEAAVRDLKEHVMGGEMKRPEKLFDNLHGAQSDDKENTERPSLLESGEGSADDGLVSKEAPRLPEEPEEEQAGEPDISTDNGAGVSGSEAEEAGGGRGLFSGDDSVSDEDGSGKGFGVGAPIVEKGEEESAQEEEWKPKTTIKPLYEPVGINASTLRLSSYAHINDKDYVVDSPENANFGWVMRYVENYGSPDEEDDLKRNKGYISETMRRAATKFLKESGYFDKKGNLTELGEYYRKTEPDSYARSAVVALATFHFINNNAPARALTEYLTEHEWTPYDFFRQELEEKWWMPKNEALRAIRGLEKLSKCPALNLPFKTFNEAFERKEGSIITALYDFASKYHSRVREHSPTASLVSREAEPGGVLAKYGIEADAAKKLLSGIQDRHPDLVGTVFTHGNDQFALRDGVTANGFAKKILEKEAGPLEEEESGTPSEAEEPTGAPQLPQEATEAAEGIETAPDAENATEGEYGASSDVPEKEEAEEEGPGPAPVIPEREEESSSATTPLLEGTGSLFDFAQEEEEGEGDEQAEGEEPETEEETKPGEKSPVMPEEEPEEEEQEPEAEPEQEQEQGSESFKGEYGEEDLDDYEERLYNEVYGDGDDDFASVKKKAKSGESASAEAEDDKTIPEGFVSSINKGETDATEGYDFDASSDDVLGIKDKSLADEEEEKEPIDVTKGPPAWNPPEEYTAIMEGRQQRAAEKKLRKSSPWSSFRMSNYLRSGERKASAHPAVKSTATLAGYTDKDGNLTKLGEALAGVADGKDNEALQNDIKGIATYNLIHNNNLVRFLTDQLSNIHAIHSQRLVEKLEQTGMPTDKAQSLIEGLKSFSTTNDFDLPFQYVGGSKGGSFVARPMGSGLAVLLGLANRSDKNLNIRDEVGYSLTDEDDSYDEFGEDSPGVRQDGVLTRYGFRDEEEAARFLDGLVKKYPDLIEGEASKKKHDFGLEGGKPIKVTDGNYRLKDGVTADQIIDRILSGAKPQEKPQVAEEPKPEPQAEQPTDLPLFQGKGAEAKQEPKKEATPIPAPVKGEEKQPQPKPEPETKPAPAAPVSTPKATAPTKKEEAQPKAKESPQDLATRARKRARDPYYIEGLQGGYYSRKRTGSGSLLEKEQTQLDWALRSAAGLDEDEARDVIKTITKGKPDSTVEDAFEYYIDCIEPLINSSQGDDQTDTMVENAQEALEELVDVVMTKYASKAKKSSKGAKQAVTKQSEKLPGLEPQKPAVPEPVIEPVATPAVTPAEEPVEEPQPEEETSPGEKAPVIEQPEKTTPEPKAQPEPKQAKSIDEYVADFAKERSRTDDPTSPDSAKRSMETSEAIAEEVRKHYGVAGLKQYMKGIGLEPTGRTGKALMEQIRSHMGNVVLAKFKSFVKHDTPFLAQLDEAWVAQDEEEEDEPGAAPIMPAGEKEEDEPGEEPDDIVPDAEETIQANLGEGAPVIDNSNVDTSLPPWEGENQFEKERRQAAKDHNDPRPPLKDPETRKWVLRAAQNAANFFPNRTDPQLRDTHTDYEIAKLFENAIDAHKEGLSEQEQKIAGTASVKKELLDLALNKYLDNHGGGVDDIEANDDGVTTDFWYREAVKRGAGKNKRMVAGPTRLIRKNFLLAIQKGLGYLEGENPNFIADHIKGKTSSLQQRDDARQKTAEELFNIPLTTTNSGKAPSEKQLKWAETARKQAAGAAHDFIANGKTINCWNAEKWERLKDMRTMYAPQSMYNKFYEKIQTDENFRKALVQHIVNKDERANNAQRWIELDQEKNYGGWDDPDYYKELEKYGKAGRNFSEEIESNVEVIAGFPDTIVQFTQFITDTNPNNIDINEAYDFIKQNSFEGAQESLNAASPTMDEYPKSLLADWDSLHNRTHLLLTVAERMSELPKEQFEQVKPLLAEFGRKYPIALAYNEGRRLDQAKKIMERDVDPVLQKLQDVVLEHRNKQPEQTKPEKDTYAAEKKALREAVLKDNPMGKPGVVLPFNPAIRETVASHVVDVYSDPSKWGSLGQSLSPTQRSDIDYILKRNFESWRKYAGDEYKKYASEAKLNTQTRNAILKAALLAYLSERGGGYINSAGKELSSNLDWEGFWMAYPASRDDNGTIATIGRPVLENEHEIPNAVSGGFRILWGEDPEGKFIGDVLKAQNERREQREQKESSYAERFFPEEISETARGYAPSPRQLQYAQKVRNTVAGVIGSFVDNGKASVYGRPTDVIEDALKGAELSPEGKETLKKLRNDAEFRAELASSLNGPSMLGARGASDASGWIKLDSAQHGVYGRATDEAIAHLKRVIRRACKVNNEQYQRGPNDAPILVRPKRQKQFRSITDAPIIV